MSGPSTEGYAPPVGDCADPISGVARTAELKSFAAALAEIVAHFYGHPEYPVPTKIDLWSHQHRTPVTVLDEFCERVSDARRYKHHAVAVDDLTPGYGLDVAYTLLVYPVDQPVEARVSGSSQP